MIKIGKPDTERFNILVVGPSNIGKKHFLQLLLQKYGIQGDLTSKKLPKLGSERVFINHLSGFSIEAAEGNLDIHLYTSQGYG